MRNKQITKILIAGLLFLLLAGTVSAEKTVIDPYFRPRLPEIMAQGTSFTAIAHGYGALFTNPAGFAMKGGDFTLLSSTGALRIDPFRLQTDMEEAGIESPGDDPTGMIDIFAKQLSDGIGTQVTTGLGIVGKGLGIGLITSIEADAQGKTLMGTEAPLYGTIALPIGFAVGLDLTETMKLSVGGDIRPMYRMAIETTAQDLIEMASGGGDPATILMDKDVRTATALAFDAGAILKIPNWQFGLSIRDLFGTQLKYSKSTMQDFIEETGVEPVEIQDTTYVIPMVARLGAAWKPDFDIFIISDPVAHAEYEIPFMPVDENFEPIKNPGSFFANLNLGASVNVLKILSLQGGLTSGYLTGGIGVDFFFLELNVAAYTEEYGPYAGDNPAAGVTAEMAIRF